MLEKLSPTSLKCFNAARQEARRLRSADLNTRHLLLGLLQQQAEWMDGLLRPYSLSAAQVIEAIRNDLPSDDHIASDKLVVSPDLKTALKQSAELAHDAPVTPSHLLLSLLDHDQTVRQLVQQLGVEPTKLSQAIRVVGVEPAAEPAAEPPTSTTEPTLPPSEGHPEQAAMTEPLTQPQVQHKPTPTLDSYSRDLTQLASEGQLYPMIGREREIAATIEILCRRMKRNPILVGEPGVGKTALAEGLAQRMVEGHVPVQLRDKRLVELSISSLVAGASQIGEFEKRLRKLVNEVKAAGDVILFIDEAHTLLGAGGGYGLQDAATILKPSLARGDIVCIGSTTTHEYRKYIEKDGALARRFQPVRVEEPNREDVLRILQTLKPRFESHFGVQIPEHLLAETFELSKNYLKNRYFPDKAIDLLERAASRAMLTGGDKPVLTVETILSVLSDIAGIPLEKLDQGEMERYLHMEDILRQRVIGQDQAIESVSSLIRLTKRRLDLDPKRPDGVFLFVGPVGVGKTELAKALTEFLFGDEDRLIRLDMSEFSSEFTVSRLIGSPPGYVGYDQGGQLTERVERQPFCVLLLDEMEKAHQSVLDLFLQIFDDGRLTDAQGRTVYFADATIIMTSNLANDLWLHRRMGFGEGAEEEIHVTEEAVMDMLRRKLPNEFLSRIDEIVIFHPLSDAAVHQIARQKLNLIVEQRFMRQNISVSFAPEVVEYVVSKGYDVRFGCRRLERVIQKEILEHLAEQMYRSDWQNVRSLSVQMVNGQVTFAKEALHGSNTDGH